MLNAVENSQAKKTSRLAVTYRAARGDMYGTCPDSCPLKPAATSTHDIDRDYELAVRRAVPRKGIAFLYTHFAPEQWAEQNTGAQNQTVFNYSADTLADAARYIKGGAASVAVVAADYWDGRASAKVTEADGVKMVRCPNETTGIDCRNCGNGAPLCARPNRDHGIVFTAHGASKRKAGDNEEAGGCYAGGGNVALHWRHLSERSETTESDGEHVKRFAAGLSPRTILRHHIAGDIGAVPRAV
jgi:hypothetical protein|tara:strand:+ start:325 stop:1053 length:729 start_codon:yes stop_codon:yes gene_type:complete